MAMTRHRPTVSDDATMPNNDKVVDDDDDDDNSIVPNGGPTIRANENNPCSNPRIVPRSLGDTIPVVNVVIAVACT
jgi:hypothetical protein